MTKQDIARVAAGLTRAQREAVLAIGNGEARRAVHFSGAVARRLCQVTGKRPALLSSRLVNSDRVALFETTAAGMAVRDHILREKSGEA